MNKFCGKCREDKALDQFHKSSKNKDGLQGWCKACNKEQRKAYYRTAHGRDKNIKTGKRSEVRMYDMVWLFLKENPCVDCGETDPIVLEFDHKDGVEKVESISSMIRRYGKQKILEEIAKCDVRCANCHRRRTAKQFGWRKLSVEGPLA